MNLFISKEDIDAIKIFINEEPTELCGHLITYDQIKTFDIEVKVPENEREDRLILYVDYEAKMEEKSCQTKKYYRYLWHTHSKISKGYPSFKDILIPLRKKPERAFVFTTFGIWEIIRRFNLKTKKQLEKNFKQKEIQYFLKQIHLRTENGKKLGENLEQREKNTLYINHVLKNIQSMFEHYNVQMEIYFTSWDQIGDENYHLY